VTFNFRPPPLEALLPPDVVASSIQCSLSRPERAQHQKQTSCRCSWFGVRSGSSNHTASHVPCPRRAPHWQLDVVDVLMTLTPATAPPSGVRAPGVPTKHGGTLGVCRDSDDEGEDDIVPDSDGESLEVGASPAVAQVAPQRVSGSALPQKSRSLKAVAAKMLTGGI